MLPHAEYLSTLPRRRLAAGVVIRDHDGGVCLVEPTYKDRWILPGGTVEADESPAQGAAREVREELGVDLAVGRLLATTWVPPQPDDPHGALLLDYDGGVVGTDVTAAFVLQSSELASYRFVPADAVSAWASSRTARRVEAALEALTTGGVVER